MVSVLTWNLWVVYEGMHGVSLCMLWMQYVPMGACMVSVVDLAI